MTRERGALACIARQIHEIGCPACHTPVVWSTPIERQGGRVHDEVDAAVFDVSAAVGDQVAEVEAW